MEVVAAIHLTHDAYDLTSNKNGYTHLFKDISPAALFTLANMSCLSREQLILPGVCKLKFFTRRGIRQGNMTREFHCAVNHLSCPQCEHKQGCLGDSGGNVH